MACIANRDLHPRLPAGGESLLSGAIPGVSIPPVRLAVCAHRSRFLVAPGGGLTFICPARLRVSSVTLFRDQSGRCSATLRVGVATLCALTAAGCRQNTSGTSTASPWASTPPAANAVAGAAAQQQQQFRTLSDLWRRQNEQFAATAAELQRRQMAQLNQLQNQTEQQIQVSEQQKAEELERQAQLARARQENLNELEQLRRNAMQLDANNRDMHAQLAQSQQEGRLLDDQVKALNKRLSDTANQLALALAPARSRNTRWSRWRRPPGKGAVLPSRPTTAWPAV